MVGIADETDRVVSGVGELTGEEEGDLAVASGDENARLTTHRVLPHVTPQRVLIRLPGRHESDG